MAKKQQPDTGSSDVRRFDKDLVEDFNDYHLPDNVWTQARNAINNSKTGDLGKLGNEPSNQFCAEIPYTVIGWIHITQNTFAIFSTDNNNSEIGIFDQDGCQYTTAVNDPCLAFNKQYLIKGVSRALSTCNYKLYWDDGFNPSRVLTVTIDPATDNAYTNPNSPIPWIQTPAPPPTGGAPCFDTVNTPDLDCDEIRLAKFIDTPCITVSKGYGLGTLFNGSYMVAVAYAIGGQKVSDWYVSNVQPLFDHDNGACSLDVKLENIDQSFDELIIAVISVVALQTVVKQAGIYSTKITSTSFDSIDPAWPVVPIDNIPIMTPIVNRTDAMYNVNEYLIRSGTTSKEDFNYQPLANQILTKWQSIEYPIDYYRKGGNNTNYLRDEVYPFFIRWVYDTGDKSASYHIPGRPGGTFWVNPTTATAENDWLLVGNGDGIPETSVGLNPYNWVVYNTGQITNPAVGTTLPDGGVVIAEGLMGYWESTERYPTEKPQIWNSNIPLSPYAAFGTVTDDFGIPLLQSGYAHDLCGKPIRHHKFPDLPLGPTVQYYNGGNNKFRIMGVKFENIKFPVLNDGITPVPGIVGYEILRGARNGNKTILAKGLICNMRTYDIQGNSTSRLGLFPNYPYNETGGPGAPGNGIGRPDPFLSLSQTSAQSCSLLGGGNTPLVSKALTRYSQNNFTFHSPDTSFSNIYLSAKELKIHGEFNGDVEGKFEISEQHPQEKLITNLSFFIAAIAGLAQAIINMTGKRARTFKNPRLPGYSASHPVTTSGFSVSYTGTYVGTSVPAAAITSNVTSTQTTPASSYSDLRTQPNSSDSSGFSSVRNDIYQAISDYNSDFASGNFFTDLLTGTTFSQTMHNNSSYPYQAWKGITDNAFTTAMNEFYQEMGLLDQLPNGIKAFYNAPVFYQYFSTGSQNVLELIKALVGYRDFALRYHSHAFYNRYLEPRFGNTRRVIEEQAYIGPQIQDFGISYRINNIYRSKTVAIGIFGTLGDTTINDVTRIPASSVDALYDQDVFNNNHLINPNKQSFGPYSAGGFTANFTEVPDGYSSITSYPTPGNATSFYPSHPGYQIASSHYASLKQRFRNQYGQLNGIVQVPASCVFPAPAVGLTATTSTVFGGDTYLGRFTEKNTFFFFYNWLYGQPDGTQLDYTKYYMIPFPTFWANFDIFEIGDFINSLGNLLSLPPSTSGIVLPGDFYCLDGQYCPGNFLGNLATSILNIKFSVKYQWFYLFNSGVKDFFVESEINVDLRDWGALTTELHFDPYRYTDTKALFETAIIKSGNYYKYDYSLSIAKLFRNYATWGSLQPITYDPYVAETCFVYTPTKVIYSLPYEYESIADNWVIFLPNNYYEFDQVVTAMKSVNKSGALIFFDAASPVQFFGVDQLQTTGGTKLTIGDGGLFDQPLQQIINADVAYEYASCQSGRSVISTPAGMFWISQNQGKIFSFQGQIADMSMQDLKWWFATYLPYQLTQAFPDYELIDNPVIGIGCQSVYDNENSLVYFCKKDFSLRKDIDKETRVEYIGINNFGIYVGDVLQFTISLGDDSTPWRDYFEDASWTISYDPKTKGWISYHDWHPNFTMPSKNTFLTIQDNKIWIHNNRCDSYCNYYGKDYPFEVEYMVNTGATVNSLRSIEYILEVYKYAPNCYDRFHVLDFNFDEAIIYNTEQVSGLLKLNLEPKNDPEAILNYPAVNFADIDVLYSKVENKYRINQFWDITDDRGEYNPNAERVIFNTSANGYVRILNPFNLNYTKDEFQRKKFRHYTNTVLLRRLVSGNRKMLVVLSNNKNLYSPR